MVLQQKEDIVAFAKTGTGKRAAFGLPLIQRVEVNNERVQSLILSPTRELSQQIYNSLIDFAKHLPEVKITLLTGGAQLKTQIEELKSPSHIVIARSEERRVGKECRCR